MKLGFVLLMVAACGDGGSTQPDAAPLPDAPCVARPPTVVFLNRTGGTYTGSMNDNSSTNTTSLVDGSVTLPPPTGVDAEWPAFVACVTSKFAPFNVTVTDTDPGAAAHLELLVVDDAQQFNLPVTATGMAPGPVCQAGAGIIRERVIVVVMWQTLANLGARCQKSAQMLGFGFGLDRSFSCPDIMTFQDTCGPAGDKTFTDEDVPCGEFEARPCTCGAGIQNTFRHLASVTRPACP